MKIGAECRKAFFSILTTTTYNAAEILILPTQTALRQGVILFMLAFLIVWQSPKDYIVTAMILRQKCMLIFYHFNQDTIL